MQGLTWCVTLVLLSTLAMATVTWGEPIEDSTKNTAEEEVATTIRNSDSMDTSHKDKVEMEVEIVMPVLQPLVENGNESNNVTFVEEEAEMTTLTVISEETEPGASSTTRKSVKNSDPPVVVIATSVVEGVKKSFRAASSSTSVLPSTFLTSALLLITVRLW